MRAAVSSVRRLVGQSGQTSSRDARYVDERRIRRERDECSDRDEIHVPVAGGKLLAASLCLQYATGSWIPDRCNYLR